MDPERRPPGGSVVVREAPPSTGGGLLYLSRDHEGRAVWTRDAAAAEHHPTLREASRAALTAPALAGTQRPAFAVPASVAAQGDPPRPTLRLVASDGEAIEPPLVANPPVAPEWPPGPAAWMWMFWAPWFEAWRLLMLPASARPQIQPRPLSPRGPGC